MPATRGQVLSPQSRGLACGLERHEHIGEGCLGLEPFRRLLHGRAFGAANPDRDREVGAIDEARRRCGRSLRREESRDASPFERHRISVMGRSTVANGGDVDLSQLHFNDLPNGGRGRLGLSADLRQTSIALPSRSVKPTKCAAFSTATPIKLSPASSAAVTAGQPSLRPARARIPASWIWETGSCISGKRAIAPDSQPDIVELLERSRRRHDEGLVPLLRRHTKRRHTLCRRRK